MIREQQDSRLLKEVGNLARFIRSRPLRCGAARLTDTLRALAQASSGLTKQASHKSNTIVIALNQIFARNLIFLKYSFSGNKTPSLDSSHWFVKTLTI
ncbi:hypothetical protein NIES4073_46160 [Kalymmatonema gypsitolerans NIES-4073]|nr:hypothetical protein NIES4073_46160 [Scytonema sp. NIES-4073]